MAEMSAPPVVGLLYPGFGAEDDFPALAKRLGGRIRLPLVHTSVGEDAHRVDALLDLGSADRLAQGARALMGSAPDSVMWACTSGSFVFGWDGARRQVDGLAEMLGLPVSSTSIAFVRAAHALDVKRVAVAASYPEEVSTHFVEFLRRGGIEVLALGSHGITTAAEVGTFDRERVLAMARAGDVAGAQAILIPDTAMHSLAWLDELEAAVGKVVLTANQVTVWQGLRLCGGSTSYKGMGQLFRV